MPYNIRVRRFSKVEVILYLAKIYYSSEALYFAITTKNDGLLMSNRFANFIFPPK